jgi:steroid 5-alpha reductase family enzyme
MGWQQLGVLFVVCAVLCAVGFYKFVYFLSIGYGFAIAGGSIVVALLMRGAPVYWLALLQMALFVAYGVRLSGFLLVREVKNAAYRKTLREATGDEKKMPVFVLLVIWLCVAVLYTAQLSPMFYRLYNGCTDVMLPLAGIFISLFGLILEAVADRQKSAQKKRNPNAVAMQGLYRIVRCPNYLGEIIFWTGVFIGGISAYRGVGQWLMASISYVCIVYIMFNGAQRLERRQMKRYGGDKAYQLYVQHTPILLPFLPLYHLNRSNAVDKR